MIYLYVCVCFVLPWTVESFSSCFGAGVTNLNEPILGVFLLFSHYCGLGAGSIAFKGHCEHKAMRDYGVMHYCMEMTRFP